MEVTQGLLDLEQWQTQAVASVQDIAHDVWSETAEVLGWCINGAYILLAVWTPVASNSVMLYYLLSGGYVDIFLVLFDLVDDITNLMFAGWTLGKIKNYPIGDI
jgi:hypothetical protein